MGIVDESLLLSLGDLWGPLGLAFLMAGIPISLVVALRPRLFWPLLMASTIIGVGPRIKGYMVLDEALTLFIVLGAMLRLTVQRRGSEPAQVSQLERLLFQGWLVYMLLQSVAGIFVNNDPRIIRWVLLYATLGCVFVVVRRHGREFPFPPLRRACVIILGATLASYITYLAQGIYYEQTLGDHGRFLSQDYVWAGSAYAVFPTLVAVPAAVFVARDRSWTVRALVWGTLGLSLTLAFYYDSRMSWMIFAGYSGALAVSRVLRLHALAGGLLLFAVLFAWYMPNPRQDAARFLEELASTSGALWNPNKSDVGRQLQLKAGWMTLVQDPKTFLVGAGVYSHRFAIIPAITALFDEFLPEQDFVIPGSRSDSGLGLKIFRTTGFTAMLVDTGVIGILWFTTLYLVCGYKVFRRGERHRYLLIMTLLIAFGWLLSNNILDIVLLYLLIMPAGLVEHLDKSLGATANTSTPTGRPGVRAGHRLSARTQVLLDSAHSVAC